MEPELENTKEGTGEQEKRQDKGRRFVGRKVAVSTPSPSTVVDEDDQGTTMVVVKASNPKVFRRRPVGSGGKVGGSGSSGPTVASITEELLRDQSLTDALSVLPHNYNFEIHKSIANLRLKKASCVALQFPEGLLLYSTTIADILERFANVETIIMGDVTYGACCIDDFTAKALGADFLIHYGHSCLVPIDVTEMNVLYVFVDIKIDVEHFIETVKLNFKPSQKLALVGTIQFSSSLHSAKNILKDTFPDIFVPQVRPLSPGEILGCTSPRLNPDVDALIYLGDGRFHLESAMISNPHLTAYRYEPYGKVFTIERYGFEEMHQIRKGEVSKASGARTVGIILGTLGRQGSPAILSLIEEVLKTRGITFITVLLSEIFPAKLELFTEVDAWIQIACPRLSIDWGYAFKKPLLNPYEAQVAFGSVPWQQIYPMDYYSKEKYIIASS